MLAATVSRLSPWDGRLHRDACAHALTVLRVLLGLSEASERREVRDALLVAVPCLFVLGVLLSSAEPLLAQTNPWEKAVVTVCKAFTGIIGRGLALVAVVIGGLMYAFGEGGSKSAIAGLIFGAGIVLGAGQFITWIGLTPGGAAAVCV